jgi:hypothetical protein
MDPATFGPTDDEMTPVATPDVVTPIEQAEPEKPDPLPREAAQVAEFTSLVTVPAFLTNWYEQYDSDRVYVNEKCMLLDQDSTVATNYILRNQIVLLANLYARDPAISWKPGPVIGQHPPDLAKYGKTLETFCSKMAEEMELRRLIRAGIQDASTVSWAIFKLNPQEDPKLDPLGTRRQDDQLDNLARYQWLLQRQQAGQISPDSALAQEIEDLKQVVIAYVQAQIEEDLINNAPAMAPVIDPMTGMPAVDPVTGEPVQQQDLNDPRLARLQQLESGQLPADTDVGEIARFLGFNLDPIQPEDFRFDWTVASPEALYQGQRMAHRVFMDYDTFGAKFDVTPEEVGQCIVYGDDGRAMGTDRRWTTGRAYQNSGSQETPTDRTDIETPSNMGRCAVWEMWHKPSGRVYVWVEGMKRFLMNYAPTVVGRRWFPFYFLPFNRVTGRAIPLSDTVLTRQLQDELNRRRTQEAEAQNAAFPRIFVRRNTLKPGEKEEIENSYPYQVIELDSPDEINKAFAETKPLPFNPELYRRDETRMEMEMMSGISRNAAGSGQGDLATTAAIANEQMGVQTDFRRGLVEELIHDILYDVAYMAVQFFPEENIKRICGPEAYWPLLGREQFLRYLKLEVRAGSTGRPDAEKNLATMEKFANVATALRLPVDGEAILEDMMYEMGKNDWRKYLLTPEKMAMRAMMGMPAGPAGAGGAPGPTAPRGNAANPTPTPGDGAPTMAEAGPPSPEGVPGPV